MVAGSNSGRGFAGALHGFNTLIGIGAAVFVAPRLWPVIDAPFWSALSRLYSHETTYWLHSAGWIALWPLTFFAARMTLSAVFAAITLMLARRMM